MLDYKDKNGILTYKFKFHRLLVSDIIYVDLDSATSLAEKVRLLI